MFNLFYLIFCLFTSTVLSSSETKECPTPLSCVDPLPDKGVIGQFCNEKHGLMSERCCISNNTLIGLDLRFCEITILNITIPDFLKVESLDLRSNSFEKFTSDELVGFLQLESLYLPMNIPCPGGKNAWVETKKESNMTFCHQQLNPCNTLNITCGSFDNAFCAHTGPGLAKCQCAPGHFGYKCLNEGTFPVAGFCTGIIIPTIVLSVVFWFVHGKDPYKFNRMN